jgi:hypothetical protein
VYLVTDYAEFWAQNAKSVNSNGAQPPRTIEGFLPQRWAARHLILYQSVRRLRWLSRRFGNVRDTSC